MVNAYSSMTPAELIAETDFETYGDYIDAQTRFIMWEEPSAEERAMLIVPMTYCPNVSELLEDSNWESLQAALAEADPTAEDYQVCSFGHWATPYKFITVRPGSEAHREAERIMARYADYPVLDEEDFSEREYAAQCEELESCISSLTIEDDGSEVDGEQLAAAMFSDMWEHDQGALERIGRAGGGSIRDSERDACLERLGYVLCDDDVWRPEGETCIVDPTDSVDRHDKLDSFTRQYLETMLWSTNDESNDRGGDPLDENYSIDDITPEAIAQAVADCERFQRENAGALEAAHDWLSDESSRDGDATTMAAHLFWLNRNGHGRGFWELHSVAGKSLSDACEAFGELWPYMGDDGKVYGLGETLAVRQTKLRVSVTYDTGTEESVSEGDHADNGWIDEPCEGRHSLTGDNRGFVLEQARAGVYQWSSLRDAMRFMADHNAQIETCWTPTDGTKTMLLYGTGNTDDCEGDEICVGYCLHIAGVSDGTMMRLARLLKSNGVYFANMFRPPNDLLKR